MAHSRAMLAQLFKSAAIALIACACALPAAAAPKVTTKTAYFTVQGSTPAAVLNSILSRGPGGNSGVAMATTQASYNQKVEPKGGRCRAALSVDILIRLPRLSKSSRTKSVRKVWGSFISYIRKHERRHRSIYIGCAKRMDKKVRAAVRKLGCKKSRSRVNAILKEEDARCNRLNRAYDQRERKRIQRLALVRQAKGGGAVGGLPKIGPVVFRKHDRNTSKRLRPSRN